MTAGTMSEHLDLQSATADRARNPALATLLFAMVSAVVANTVLGPLGTGSIGYPISHSLQNQLIGLEIVSIGLVAPAAVIAGVLALRAHPAAGPLGLGSASYVAYMFVQYVLGPEYPTYTLTAFLHTAIVALACVTAACSWLLGSRQPLPQLTDRSRRMFGAVLLLLAAFIVSRYASALSGAFTGAAIPAESSAARSFFWSIFLLDLGAVVPATVATAVGLFCRAAVAQAAMYAVVIWYALVPPSVAAMSVTMLIDADPNASLGQASFLVVFSAIFMVLAAWICRPLLRIGAPQET